MSVPLNTTDPERFHRPARMRSLRIGEITVTHLPDGHVQLPPTGWLPDTTDAEWAAQPQYLDATGHLVASIGSLLVESPSGWLLIDSGFGPYSLPADPETPRGPIVGGALPASLAVAGRRMQDVETVATSHLHPDHLGWAVQPVNGDLASLSSATVLVAEAEWADRDHLAASGVTDERLAALADRVLPIHDGHQVLPGVRARVTGGHTPGHTEYIVESGGQRLIAFGDSMHSPAQVGHPEWASAVDSGPAASKRRREELISELQEPDTIGYGNHFADVVFGRVETVHRIPTWIPVAAAVA